MSETDDAVPARASDPHTHTLPQAREGARVAARLIVVLVVLYRASLGRLLGGQCRFHPSCSQYIIDAVKRHGAWRGTGRGIRRIARCRPGGGSGYDPA